MQKHSRTHQQGIAMLPKTINLNSTSIETKRKGNRGSIYKCILYALESEWFLSLGQRTQENYERVIVNFSEWLNISTSIDKAPLAVINQFEAYRVNDCKVQVQSTGAELALKILKEGKDLNKLGTKEFRYIENLINATKISPVAERKQSTITNFFSQAPWIRSVLGEKEYLKLESPKILTNSFSVSIASILLQIIQCKKLITELIKTLEDTEIQSIDNSKKNSDFQFYLLKNHLKKTAANYKVDIVFNFLITDFTHKKFRADILKGIDKGKLNKYIRREKKDSGHRSTFSPPKIFTKSLLDKASYLEEHLMLWLCAWQMIQPEETYSLKENDFIRTRNTQGRLISIQCNYFKTRAARIYEPPILDSSTIECKAIEAYIERLDQGESLFKLHKTKQEGFSNPTNSKTHFQLLSELFSNNYIYSLIYSELKARQASPIFIKAYCALFDFGGISYDCWHHRKGPKISSIERSVKNYKKETENYLPISMLSLSSIKNTSVHSRTDKYRADDLVNENSHSADVEKKSYLTEDNKEWINREGRVSRMVMNDINNHFFSPHRKAAAEEAMEKLSLTNIINQDNYDQIRVNSIGEATTNEHIDHDPAEILVIDSAETALSMLHYLSEAKLKEKILISNCLSFYEKTVLPTVEWMEVLLSTRLGPKLVKQARRKYQHIQPLLPSLFEPQIQTGGID